MKIDRFLQFFVVKEKKFYPLYMKQAVTIQEAADLLQKLLLEKDHDKQTSLYRAIKAAENEGDRVTAEIFEELNRTFVTPFDREDINHLGSRMDTFLDFIHDAAKRIVMYRPQQINDTLLAMGSSIAEDARIITDIMERLEFIQKKSDSIIESCIQIKKIEHEVDNLYEEFMSDVFANEKDAIELVKLKNIGQALEDATDRAKDVGDVIRGIIVKFA